MAATDSIRRQVDETADQCASHVYEPGERPDGEREFVMPWGESLGLLAGGARRRGHGCGRRRIVPGSGHTSGPRWVV
ncbi:hypothetical protein PV379_14955 [Streptomyces caniscabiei]|uniref:hypothetical protein n=1 Tax=Streptomyces caniscabiei TaxID=2746961 RepID=UPI0029A2AC46|nr:hypothetical protein [Streptomyces caniscabiei]MDX2778602.1 hypothetical protein [Streptomyces caniscabiei]